MSHCTRPHSKAISFSLVICAALISAMSVADPPEVVRRSADTARGHASVPSPHLNEAGALNPQPMPPKSGNRVPSHATPYATKGSKTAIIIVSGESGTPAREKKHFGQTPVPTTKDKAPAQIESVEHRR